MQRGGFSFVPLVLFRDSNRAEWLVLGLCSPVFQFSAISCVSFGSSWDVAREPLLA